MLSNIILRLTKQGTNMAGCWRTAEKTQSWFYDQLKKPTSSQRLLHICCGNLQLFKTNSESLCLSVDCLDPVFVAISWAPSTLKQHPPLFHSQPFQGTARSSLSWPRRQIRCRSFESWLSLQKIIWTRVVCRGLFPTWDNHLPTLWRLHIVLNTSIYKPQRNDLYRISCLDW